MSDDGRFSSLAYSDIHLLMLVRIGPGAYALTVILCFPNSSAAHCVNPRTANLLAQYADRYGLPSGEDELDPELTLMAFLIRTYHFFQRSK